MDDIDKTMVPQRKNVFSADDDVMTVPGKRNRKPDGRFQVGDLIMNRYKVLAELGQGGMGVVYKCFDEDAGIEVALKALPPDLSHNTIEMEDIKENFQLVHNLHHPNIASSNTLELDRSNGNYYLIMECCEGEDLRRWIKRKRKEGDLTLEDVLPIIQQVASALDYAHEMKIMHRDIKPGNIMIDQFGKIKVLDFGLAAQIHTSMTRVSMAYHGTSGTGPYMAPEQWRGRAQGTPADQYALAVMAYEMLAGHLPFESADPAVLQQAVLTQCAEEISGIPRFAQAAIKCAMSKEPSERFASCSDFAAALGGKKIKAAKVQKKSGFPGWAAILLIAVLLGAGGAGYYFFDKHQKEQARLEQLDSLLSSAQEAKEKSQWQAVLVSAENILKLDAGNVEAKRLIAEAKVAIAQAEKERLAGQERLRKLTEEQLDSENAALKVDLSQKIAKIKRKNYDPGQTFGEKTDEMERAFATAREAKLLITANKEYKKAKQLAEWLLLNGELREKAKAERKKAQNNRSAAEEYEPSTYANGLFSTAVKLYQTAEKYYKDMKFAEAENSFHKAAKGFEQAKNTAFDNKLQFLTAGARKAEKSAKWNELKIWAGKIRPLNKPLADQFTNKADNELKAVAVEKELSFARSAKAEKNWQKMYDYAVAALKIDSGNSEAKNLKQQAENNLIPTLNVYAYVDGKTVNATVKSLKTRPDWQSRPWKLQKGSEYEFEVTYKDGENEYYGRIPAFTCTANGLHRKEVHLTKVEFNGTVTLPGNVMLEMVKIRASTFMMGSPEGELGRYSDETQHRVTLTKDYWLGKFEVTQAQYEALMGKNPSSCKGSNRPVEWVSWEDAKEFCNKLNEKYAGKLPAGYKFDLPTEAQWEYACRAGTTTALNNGTNLTSETGSCSNLNEVGWYGSNYGYGEHKAVGQKRPNSWGLYDMHGNVWEWCRDWYGSYGGEATDPVGPSSGSGRVDRGGSWSFYAKFCRSARRDRSEPGLRSSHLGFRLALVPVQ